MARLGVLALQGDFAAHVAALDRLGVESVEVRRTAELDIRSAHGRIVVIGLLVGTDELARTTL